jgi:hypothetical protein
MSTLSSTYFAYCDTVIGTSKSMDYYCVTLGSAGSQCQLTLFFAEREPLIQMREAITRALEGLEKSDV